MHSFRNRNSRRYGPLRQHGILNCPILSSPEHSKVYNFLLKVTINIIKRRKHLVCSLNIFTHEGLKCYYS